MNQSQLRSSNTRVVGSQKTPRHYGYERLMQVSIRHDFYNASDNLCPDFRIVPTADSINIMCSLGLLFQYEGTGFAVLLDKNRQANFLSYLEAQSPVKNSWTRLSFMLSTASPNFVNFTDMPIGTSPSEKTYYFSNIATENKDGAVYLNSGPLGPQMEVPLTGSQYRTEVRSTTTNQIRVKDIAGNVVMCQPVWWYSNLGEHPSPTCGAEPSPQDPDAVRRNPIYLDFSAMPEDKYGIEEYPSASDAPAPQEVVYAFSTPSPMIFIDLLFTQPPGVTTGVYPVDFAGNPEIVPTQYFLAFTNRSTVWNYYIVSTGVTLTDLQVHAADHSPGVTFSGPTPVSLPNRQTASCFVSNAPIPLQEQSDYNFQLKGRAGGIEMKDGVLMNRLPVASSQQVIPGRSDFAYAGSAPYGPTAGNQQDYSDIYVYI